MSLLLMVILVGISLSALIVPMVISQNRSTRFSTSRVQSLGAAQAGVDVAVGLIRGAVSDTQGVTYGDSTKLPCGPISGVVTGPATGTTGTGTGTATGVGPGTATYNVTIEYFTFDPVSEPTVTTKNMNCSVGFGVYDPSVAAYTPSFARITSTGTVGTAVNGLSAGRTLITTYVFKTTNMNIPGGSIQLGGSTSALCMDVGSASAIAGAPVVLQTCSNLTSPIDQQSFAYRTDLTLQLVSSVTKANLTGLCLTPSGNPPAVTNGIQLSQCLASSSPNYYTQQWSYNDAGKYQSAPSTPNADGSLPDMCMGAAAQSGVSVSLVRCGTAPYWIPATSVGPGGAALPQRVNYSEFGRCLDVPNADVNTTHLVDYPCKQNPAPSAVAWNEKFLVDPAVNPALPFNTGQIYVMNSASAKYCLTSPGTSGVYVTLGQLSGGVVQPCGPAGTAAQTWKIYGGDASLTYANKYTIVDSAGLCLGLTTPASGEPWSAVDVETCSAATELKWNASPNLLNSSLQNTREK